MAKSQSERDKCRTRPAGEYTGSVRLNPKRAKKLRKHIMKGESLSKFLIRHFNLDDTNDDVFTQRTYQENNKIISSDRTELTED